MYRWWWSGKQKFIWTVKRVAELSGCTEVAIGSQFALPLTSALTILVFVTLTTLSEMEDSKVKTVFPAYIQLKSVHHNYKVLQRTLQM